MSPLNCLGKVHRLPQQQSREERQSFDDSCWQQIEGGWREINKMIISTVFFLIRFKVIKSKFWKLNMNICNLLVNYSWNIHGQIFGTKTMMHTLREETFANNIFAVYGLICKDLLLENKILLWKTLWMLWKTLRFSKKTCKNWTRFAKICSAKLFLG